ncbi:hypothetical protein B0J14DRAFT_10967 [Halenospora varia]|nr:hypothetical protein B0J14DRAFT_10967 [Halenospora varia]
MRCNQEDTTVHMQSLVNCIHRNDTQYVRLAKWAPGFFCAIFIEPQYLLLPALVVHILLFYKLCGVSIMDIRWEDPSLIYKFSKRSLQAGLPDLRCSAYGPIFLPRLCFLIYSWLCTTFLLL